MLVPSRGARVLVLELAQRAVRSLSQDFMLAQTLLSFPISLPSWVLGRVFMSQTTKAFLGNESSLLPLTCWSETMSSRPLSGEAQ